MSFPTIFGAILLSLSLPVFAQETAPANVQKQGPAVKALVLTQGAVSLDLFTVVGDKMSEPFNVGSWGLSESFYPGKTFNLAMKDTAAENGARMVSTITLPDGGNEFILLLEPTADKQFKPYIINSRNREFRENSILFFNASTQPVGVTLDEKKAVIQPRKIEILAAPEKKGDIPYYNAALFHPQGTKTRMFASSRWLHRPDGRNYVFVFQDSKSGTYDCRILDESLIPDSPAAN